jgi:hypothetical protein
MWRRRSAIWLQPEGPPMCSPRLRLVRAAKGRPTRAARLARVSGQRGSGARRKSQSQAVTVFSATARVMAISWKESQKEPRITMAPSGPAATEAVLNRQKRWSDQARFATY